MSIRYSDIGWVQYGDKWSYAGGKEVREDWLHTATQQQEDTTQAQQQSQVPGKAGAKE